MTKEIFLLADFLMDADKRIFSFQEEAEKTVWDNLLKKTDDALPEIDLNTKYLKEMTLIAQSLKADALKTAEFFRANKAAIVKRNLKIETFAPYDIEEISAAALGRYVDSVESLFKKLSDGKAGKKDVEQFINDPKEIARWKYSTVKIRGGGRYYTSKDVLNFENRKEVVLTADAVEKNVIAFLQQYAREKADPYEGKDTDSYELTGRTFATLAKVVKKSILDGFTRLNQIEASAVKSDISKDIVTRVIYAAKNNYLELSKFLIAASLKYMTEWTSDVRMLKNLMIQISNTLPSSTAESDLNAEFESAGLTMDNCSILQAEILATAAQKLISDLSFNPTDPENDVEEYETAEDKRAYDLILQMLEAYLEKLGEATTYYEENIQKVSVELILRRFDLTSPDFWKTINGELSVNNKFLRSVNFHPVIVKHDLEKMKIFSVKIAQLYKENMSRLDHFINLVKAGKSTDYTSEVDTFDMDSIEDKKAMMVSKLEDLYSSFELAGRELMKRYIQRISTIDSNIHQELGSTNSFVSDSHDYFLDAFNANYDMIVEDHEEKLKDIFSFYEHAYLNTISDVGDLFVEATGNNQNQQGQGNGNTTPQQTTAPAAGQPTNNQGTNNQGNNQNKSDPKPTVDDRSDNANNNNQNNDQNNGNNQNGDNGSKQKISDRVSKFISGVIDKVKGFFTKNNAKSKNLDFINEYRDYLNSRNYANVAISILPYIDADYIKNTNGVINQAKSLTPDQMKNLSEDAMYKFLYINSKYAAVQGNSPAERYETAIKVGTQKNELISIRNGAIKKEVAIMIQYVENYYNHTEKELDDLNAATKDLSNLDNVSGTDGRIEDNKKLVPRIINEAIGSAINVSRKRANDYMIILNSLVPESEKQKHQQQNQNNNNNQNNGNNNNQNDQNQNNNGNDQNQGNNNQQ